jgi:spermidine synthase
MIAEFRDMALLFAGIAVVNLFTLSVALHSRLFESRPEPRHLTLFYLAMSAGGMLGGIFCGLVAPLIFDWTYEHLLLLIAAAWLIVAQNPFQRLASLWKSGDRARKLTAAGVAVAAVLAVAGHGLFGTAEMHFVSAVAFAAILVLGVLAIGNRPLFTASVAALILTGAAWDRLVLSASPGKMTRSFFGIYSIEPVGNDGRMLKHGTTAHGAQNLGSVERERMPTTYYAPGSGVGLAMQAAPRLFGDRARIDVVGLGAGTLACYARPGQSWTFYEIDPVVVGIAKDPRRFTFLSRCLPGANIIVGDARLSLEHAAPAAADLLVVDAFSSDSIPMHLLTREAFTAYGRHLSDRGLLLVHISNRHLDLQPVLAAAAAAEGWQARVRDYKPGLADAGRNYTRSIWVALSKDRRTLQQLTGSGEEWRPLSARRAVAWTDDYASLLPLIRWRS